jgi:hypothetical protein
VKSTDRLLFWERLNDFLLLNMEARFYKNGFAKVSPMKLRSLAESFPLILTAAALFCLPLFAQKRERNPPISPKLLQAKSVYLDCDCRKEMAASVPSALPELLDWGRYEVLHDWNRADLILLFSMNPYLGDYFMRDGPDKRPALVDYTILSVIDGHTGELLWNDYKRWGYGRVRGASKALMHEFRLAVEGQATPRLRIAP